MSKYITSASAIKELFPNSYSAISKSDHTIIEDKVVDILMLHHKKCNNTGSPYRPVLADKNGVLYVAKQDSDFEHTVLFEEVVGSSISRYLGVDSPIVDSTFWLNNPYVVTPFVHDADHPKVEDLPIYAHKGILARVLAGDPQVWQEEVEFSIDINTGNYFIREGSPVQIDFQSGCGYDVRDMAEYLAKKKINFSLDNPEIADQVEMLKQLAVRDFLYEALGDFVDLNPHEAKVVVDKAVNAADNIELIVNQVSSFSNLS